MIEKSKGCFTIITAGGIGSRMQAGIPKQFMLLNGLPILMQTINVFKRYDSSMKIVLSLPENFHTYWNELSIKYDYEQEVTLVAGGKTRFHSVQNALKEISGEGYIAVHDGVRPMVSQATISEAFRSAELYGSAIPVCDIPFSIRKVEDSGSRNVYRENYKEVQTPQVFEAQLLRKAYKQTYNKKFTDDASVVERVGGKIHLSKGNRENIKITYPADLKFAEIIMANNK